MRRFLLWALERWTGDRYVRVTLLREAAEMLDWHSSTIALYSIDATIRYANDHERGSR